jgi:hypothetical protein
MSAIKLTDEQPRPPECDPAIQAQVVRVRLRDLPIPPEVIEDVNYWYTRTGGGGKKRRQEIEEEFKLQYYFGGQAIYVMSSAEGTVVIPIPECLSGTPDLRYFLFTAEERQRVCSTVPSRWNGTDSIIS